MADSGSQRSSERPVTDGEEHQAEDHQSSDRWSIRQWGPVRRWTWYRQMQRVYSGEPAGQRERDIKENERSRLPESESIAVPAVWVVELYTPSTISGLLTGVAKLGWEYGRSRDDSLVEWMGNVRQGRHAGWTSLGLVSRPDRRDSMAERLALLPAGVEAALPVLISLTSSLTALVIAFVMTDEGASVLDGPLHAEYHTQSGRDRLFRWWHVIPYVLWDGPIRAGRHIYSPDLRRRKELRAILGGLELSCSAWVAERMPGAFCRGTNGDKLPTVALLVTEAAAPLTQETHQPWAFGALSLNRDYAAWESEEWPGARLVLPELSGGEDWRLTFACRRHDAFQDNRGYYEPESNWTIAQRADDYVRGLASRWAISCLLDLFQERVSALRDRSATRRLFRPVRDLKTLRSLTQSQLYDVMTSTQEIAEFVKADRGYGHDVLEMRYVHSKGDKPLELLQELKSSQASRSQLVQQDVTLLQSTLSIVSDITQTISNIRIQRVLVILAVVSIIVAFIAIIIAVQSAA